MKWLIATAFAVLALNTSARAQTVIVSQAPTSGGTARASQLWQDPGPDGNDLDGDAVCFSGFVLTSPATIDHIEWWGSGACEQGFRIEFWRQDPNTVAFQPMGFFYYGGVETVEPEARFDTTAYTTEAGPYGFTHYSLDLAAPVSLPANTPENVRWFVSVIGLTSIPYAQWNWAQGTGAIGTAQFIRGLPFRAFGNGRAMLLRAAGGTQVSIAASTSPIGAGSITGAGAYPVGSTVSLLATPNTGWTFTNWTESGTVVHDQRDYAFTAATDRTLVANFVPAYTITTSAMPYYGGSTNGDAIYSIGDTVTVEALPVNGYAFSRWSSLGQTVSTEAMYTFPAATNLALVAEFVPETNTAVFTFDDAPVHTSIPVSLSNNGLGAQVSGTGGSFSIQPANTLGLTPAGFGGLCLYPNSVFGGDLLVSFSRPLTGFSIMYCALELGCDDSSTMRVTGYMSGEFVATDTTTAPVPGTYPTGTLSLVSAAPFDSVVVHYDAHPPICQDWGPAYLADNMIAVMAATTCAADFDGSGAVAVPDIFVFLSAWFSLSAAADFDHNGTVAVPDIFAFLSAWFAGCP